MVVCNLQAKVKYHNELKQVMSRSEDLSRSLEIKPIWTFESEFPTVYSDVTLNIMYSLQTGCKNAHFNYLRFLKDFNTDE